MDNKYYIYLDNHVHNGLYAVVNSDEEVQKIILDIPIVENTGITVSHMNDDGSTTSIIYQYINGAWEYA